MSFLDKFKSKPSFFKKDMEEQIMDQKLGDICDWMADKLMENKKPVKMTICYLDVKYEISCERVEDFVEELRKGVEQ